MFGGKRREYDRIERICGLLRKLWQSSEFNDLRFWQFLEVVMTRYRSVGDFFFVEDDETEEILKGMIDEFVKK